MTWNFLRPTRWKTFLSLFFFLFPLIQSIVELEIKYQVLPVGDGDFLLVPLGVIAVVESFIAQPFKLLLEQLGYWSRGGFIDSPLLPGSFAVAIIYSLLIYIIWSLISLWRSKKIEEEKL